MFVYSARALLRRPLFAVEAIVTLAIGIGGATALFSVVNAVLLRSLPFPEPERIVKVSLVSLDEPDMVWSYPKYEVLRDENRVFSQVAGYARWTGSLSGEGDPERLEGEMVTARYFDLLGVLPTAGRVFTEEETRDPGRAKCSAAGRGVEAPAVQCGSDGGWPHCTEGNPTTVVGIVPADFRGLTGVADIFVPMALVGPQMLAGPRAHFMTVVARLARGRDLRERTQ
jgi:putative ABC transport system permease protein